MNENKHTSGPWFVFDRKGNGSAYSSTMPTICGMGGAPVIADIRWNGHNVEHGAANAHLIAAAPEMLQALNDLTNEINLSKLNIRKDFSLINAHACALKAIAKAEGRI